MRAVIQRVDRASVSVHNREISSIDKGILVFLGVEKGDSKKDSDYILDKIVNLRIFEDDAGKMNRSVLELGGDMMIISQFTLLADCRKGRRPSFFNAEEPDLAKTLYDYFVSMGQNRLKRVATGEFQTMMTITAVNHGPVTIFLDSKRDVEHARK